jgi:hypothetical protein
MPNHITNLLKIIASTPERLQEVKVFIRGEEDGVELPIDFNKVLPMPESLRIESDEKRDNGLAILLHRNGDSRKIYEIMQYVWVNWEGITDVETLIKRLIDRGDVDFEGARQAIKNLEVHGYMDGYSWAVDKWGTKCNAYDQKDDGETISFDTAWRTPLSVFVALSKQFPDVEFNVKYADEDFGYNVGEFTLLDGEVIYEDMPEDGSFEAFLMSSVIKGYDYFFLDECCYIDPDYTVDDLSNREKRMIRLVYERQLFHDTDIQNFPKAVVDYLIEIAMQKQDYENAAKLKESQIAPE